MSSAVTVSGGVQPAFLDDSERTTAANGMPATSDLLSREVVLANQLAHAGRPFYSFATDALYAEDNTSLYRQVYMSANRGATSVGGSVLWMTHQNVAPPGFQTGQGFQIAIDGTPYLTPLSYDGVATTLYPGDTQQGRLFAGYGYSALPVETIIGAPTTNNPQLFAGTAWQNPVNIVDSAAASFAGHADLHQKGDIVGAVSAGQEDLTSLLDVVSNTWFHQRPQVGWSYLMPGQISADNRYINFSTSSQNYRYIFDQSFGAGGGGTAFSATGPAMTLPLGNAGSGRHTQLRVYVFVYASMSGATDSGSIGIANKGASGTMATAATALVSGDTITGSTFRWYPTLSTWSPSTAPFFLAYTGSPFDRVALCARSNGATDAIRVGAFTFIVAPAVA